MSSPSSSNHEGNNAWLMKIELKREEPMEINKDEGIKKAMEDQVPATEGAYHRTQGHYTQVRGPPTLDV